MCKQFVIDLFPILCLWLSVDGCVTVMSLPCNFVYMVIPAEGLKGLISAHQLKCVVIMALFKSS